MVSAFLRSSGFRGFWLPGAAWVCAALLCAACSSSSSGGDTGFGDGGMTRAPDATTGRHPEPKHDAGVVPPHVDAERADVGSVGEGGTGACTTDTDCASKVCASLGALTCEMSPGVKCTCQPATCTDGVQNGTETDVDCGGGACPKCKDGDICLLGHQDCVSGECGVGTQGAACDPGDAGPGGCVCEVPTCSDGVKNGAETDIDCGSSGTCLAGETCVACSSCTTGKICTAPMDCISATCTTAICACPPGMTEASTSLNVPYCIDAYEATYTEYTNFKNAHTVTEQPAYCSWNLTYAPKENFPQLPAWSNNPVTNVNWCDAYMYCHTQAKHLCGHIADPALGISEGDPISPAEANIATKDEWYNACSDQGANQFPYSATMYGPNTCNGADSVVAAELPDGCNNEEPGSPSPVLTVAAMETLAPLGPTGACEPVNFMEDICIGGTSNQLFDMSGNVAEWENSCASYADGGAGGADGGMTDLCNVRGGAYDSPRYGLTCGTSTSQPQVPRDSTPNDVGIRCCL